MKKKTKVFYDGNCKICSREINFYKKLDEEKKISWLDIHKSSTKYKSINLKKKELMDILHLQTENGEILKGVDAFIKIWSNVKYFGLLAFCLKFYPLKKIFNFIYMIWAKNRKIRY